MREVISEIFGKWLGRVYSGRIIPGKWGQLSVLRGISDWAKLERGPNDHTLVSETFLVRLGIFSGISFASCECNGFYVATVGLIDPCTKVSSSLSFKKELSVVHTTRVPVLPSAVLACDKRGSSFTSERKPNLGLVCEDHDSPDPPQVRS